MNLGICDCNAAVVDDSNKCAAGTCGFLYDQLLQHPVQPVSNPAFASLVDTPQALAETKSIVWSAGAILIAVIAYKSK